MRECPLRANHPGQRRPRKTSHLLYIIVIIHIHNEPPEKKSVLILKPHRRNAMWPENLWFNGVMGIKTFVTRYFGLLVLQKDLAANFRLRDEKELCPSERWRKHSTRMTRFQACCPPLLPFALSPSRLLFLACPFAVKAATRVAENNDIIAGPLAAYGN